jgi:hypothetical protein
MHGGLFSISNLFAPPGLCCLKFEVPNNPLIYRGCDARRSFTPPLLIKKPSIAQQIRSF